MTETFREHLLETFGFLTAAGFSLEIETYRPEVFGNYSALFTSPDVQIRLVSDRSEVFVDIRILGGHWCDKEVLLEQAGIPRSRHPMTKLGLWSGYREDLQARDLEKYLQILKTAVSAARSA
jgi:hypothetical protein